MMASDRQKDILTLFKHVDKSVIPKTAFERHGHSLVPTKEESRQILSKLNLASLGIGRTPRGQPCSFFQRQRLKEAVSLALLLKRQPTFDEFLRTAIAIRSRVNEEIYVYALMYALLNRDDSKDFHLPPVEEIVPYWYFPLTLILEAQRRVKRAKTPEEKIVVPYEFAHNPLDPEYRMAYFREDLGVNSHHYHWHLAYPHTWTPADGGSKDRKGELFIYMHQQMLARYDAERLCNTLNRVQAFNDFYHAIETAYFPNLISTKDGTPYASRPVNMIPMDVEDAPVARLELWKSRIMDAIHTGFVLDPSGNKVPLVEPSGIDMLGAIVEAAAISINQRYYGDFHNTGHVVIAKVHDPQGKYGGNLGVMGFTATAMRDPIFYNYHRAVDNIAEEYRQTLQLYTKQELEWSDVVLSRVSVTGNSSKVLNSLETFWQKRKVLLSSGVDFQAPNPVMVLCTELNHEEFEYELEVNNHSSKELQGVFRIFLAPVSNEFNEPLTLPEQRKFFMELDKFHIELKPGKQVVTRRSQQSNVTTNPPRGFLKLKKLPTAAPSPSVKEYCGCGWPHNLLIPKGRVEGMRFQLFVMVTDWENDKANDYLDKRCGDAASYCGIRDQKYPDKRPMGFPFDRPITEASTWDTFLTNNMTTTEIIIRHTGKTVGPKGVVEPAKVF